MRRSVGVLIGITLVAAATPGSAQINPANMRSGVDSLTVPSGGTLVSERRVIFTVPAGNTFVLTDLVCSRDTGIPVEHEVLDNGTALRWGPVESGTTTRWSTGIVFTAGHSVVLRGIALEPNVPTPIHYSWSGYLVPDAVGAVPGSHFEQLGFALAPNPSKQVVTLRFELREPADVALGIYDVQGRKVRMLRTGRATSGPHSVTWDGRNSEGTAVSPGTYFARLASSGSKSVKTLVRIR